MRNLSHSQDDQAWEILLTLLSAKPNASPASLVHKAYEVATEFEKVRRGRPTEPPHQAEPTSGHGG